ncbi:uncharacterized protein LOC111051554 [Nilaparvata lugens]|uniref:uncharacterized protein LOC111051554 n=1 Tax=Nilaparvata lugens TaxID=108931 RepID=UPI00193E7B7C|nr:uncharacterized protein LOC111051554 [Nilaparvata lugens]
MLATVFAGIVIDLKKPCFEPGKSNYDRTKRSLSKFNPVNLEFIIAWETHDEKICPSTIAKYFSDKGYTVQQCEPHFKYRVDKGIPVPELGETPQQELLEWLGAHSLGVFRKDNSFTSVETSEYLSSYAAPNDCTKSEKTVLFQWTGFFTRKKILDLFKRLRWVLNENCRTGCFPGSGAG